MPPSSVEVPFLPQTPVLAVSRAQFGFPEDQATSQTRPVNSQGVTRGCVVPAVCCSACVRGVFAVDSDAKIRKNSVFGALAPSGGRHKICIQLTKCKVCGLVSGPKKAVEKLAIAPGASDASTLCLSSLASPYRAQPPGRHQIESPKRPPKKSAQGRLPQSDLPQ